MVFARSTQTGRQWTAKTKGGQTMATFRFIVHFDANKPTPVWITSPTAAPYHAPPEEISLITFTLDNAISSGAEFPTNPIQWVVDHKPVALPPWFAMHRLDAGYFSLW